MQQPQSSLPTADNFANILASLTGPEPNLADSWDDSALADDVATISYEQALKTQGRGKLSADSRSAARSNGNGPKATMVTLRLSQAESAQLRERAAEAGLTVSAYLRSCVFDVESLRAQVREALSQLRAAALSGPQITHKPAARASKMWRPGFFARWSRGQRSINF
jgi:hypothetical protein